MSLRGIVERRPFGHASSIEITALGEVCPVGCHDIRDHLVACRSWRLTFAEALEYAWNVEPIARALILFGRARNTRRMLVKAVIEGFGLSSL
jgi:hypothetical protein